MFQDTLVALDWDGRTPIPYLAKSWTVSPDGKTYTFKLRDDVSFCSGKKFTADDVVFSFKRLKSPEIKGPFAWRAGTIKDLRAPDPYTVEYELAEPFSDLLLQLTMFTNVIHNKESVEALGKDYGVKGADGTGPWCFDSWQPRTQIVLKRHDAYRWGPSMYQNKGPVKFEKLVDQDRAGGFQPRRRHDGGAVRHHAPVSAAVHRPGQDRADADRDPGQAQLPAALFRLQDQPAHGGRQARARGHEHRHQPRRDRQGHPAWAMPIPPTPSSIPARSTSPRDQGHGQGGHGARPRSCSTRRAGSPAPTACARRTASSSSPRSTTPRPATRRASPRRSRATCGSIGVHWQLQPWDSTIAPLKMAEQDYEIWSVTVPYLSAGDLMNIYFDSRNIPTPNRMNWKDAETDEWLRLGRSALSEADRFKYYELVQKKVTAEHAVDAGAQHQHVRGHQQEGEGHAPAHDLPEHFLQGAGREFLINPSSRPKPSAARRSGGTYSLVSTVNSKKRSLGCAAPWAASLGMTE